MPPPATIAAHLSLLGHGGPGWRAKVERLVAFTLKAERRTVEQLDVAIVDAASMTDYHAQYMNDPTPTDVLTFDLSEPPPGKSTDKKPPIAGQILVCRDVAREQAAGRKHGVQQELLLYVLHGLLHLCGYDDLTPKEHARMHAREDEVLTELGLSARYAD